jgi:hypothetical protein
MASSGTLGGGDVLDVRARLTRLRRRVSREQSPRLADETRWHTEHTALLISTLKWALLGRQADRVRTDTRLPPPCRAYVFRAWVSDSFQMTLARRADQHAPLSRYFPSARSGMRPPGVPRDVRYRVRRFSLRVSACSASSGLTMRSASLTGSVVHVLASVGSWASRGPVCGDRLTRARSLSSTSIWTKA